MWVEVWVSVLGYREVLGEVWGSVLGVGGVGKCVGVWERCRKMLGEVWRCVKVCWGVGEGVRKC